KKTSSLSDIAKKILTCRNCGLGATRINGVPGEGVEQPYVMVIGEGPGEEEDKSGRPFVGKAGQLLDKMLASISLDRECNCYIANIVKCRPPKNRTPLPQEAEACAGYLQAQIHIARPKMILAMGRTAIQNLLHTTEGINALRGKFLDYNGIPVMATYHPSALLRDESLKRPAWEDLKTFRAKLEASFPDYKNAFNAKHEQAAH
ncbi:MAG: uracil-DNA glycosylase, partial [Treponema sp.]|nr:uracil-DNA glycosylase [Treponema sp.]